MSEGNGFWAIVGKASVFVGLVLGLFAARDAIWPSEPVIEAKCQSLTLRSIGQTSIMDLKSPEGLSSAIGDVAKTIDGKDLILISGSLADELDKSFDAHVERYGDVGYSECEIGNFGSKNAVNVEFEVPESVFSVHFEGKIVDISSSRKIKIGTLRPKDSVYINFFSINAMSQYHERLYSINYDDGVGVISVAQPAYGWTGEFVEMIDSGAFWFILGIPVLLIFLYGLLASFHVKNTLSNAGGEGRKEPESKPDGNSE